jgi:hypothetical protein
VEFKFLLSPDQAESVRGMLMPHVEMDPFAAARPGGRYTVWSLYLDTRALDFYHEKLAGLRDRMKVRVRAYNDLGVDHPVFLEVKRKSGSAITKRRAAVRYSDLQAVMASGDMDRYVLPGANPGESSANAREFLYHAYRRCLAPVVIVAYEREAYSSRHEGGLRITLDSGLRSYLAEDLSFDGADGPPVNALGQSVILEVKSNFGLPLWMKVILSRADANKEALSKYIICIDSLSAAGIRCGPTHNWAIRDGCISLHSSQV